MVDPVKRAFMVISVDALNRAGTVVVVEIDDSDYSGVRRMLAVPLGDTDPLAGRHVLAWRLNWLRADRLGEYIGQAHPDTVERVVAAAKAAIEP